VPLTTSAPSKEPAKTALRAMRTMAARMTYAITSMAYGNTPLRLMRVRTPNGLPRLRRVRLIPSDQRSLSAPVRATVTVPA
jgi:hypothetical protein